MVLAFVLGIWIANYFFKKKKIKADVYDLAFWLILGGVLGARLYEVFIINWGYYIENLDAIFKIWQGGLAIHGGIIGGGLALWVWAKRNKINFWKLADILVIILPLGQAIGRWGNYFNGELFGLPTSGWWGIPIDIALRPLEYINFEYFHPAFLYESFLNLCLFGILLWVYSVKTSNDSVIARESRQGDRSNLVQKGKYYKTGTLVIIYLIGYGLIRFFMEYVRIDPTPEVLFGLKLPQFFSILMVLVAGFIYFSSIPPPCLRRGRGGG